jgi:hypothetical protein
MAILHNSLPSVSTKVFSHDRNTKKLFSEISTALGHREFGHIYDDATDVGLKTVNPLTGAETIWYLDSIHQNDEGETESFILKPISIKNQKQKGYEMILFND